MKLTPLQAGFVEVMRKGEQRRTLKINTHLLQIPADPLRDFNWTATKDGHEPSDPIGFGLTEQDAIDDLRDQLSEEQ